MKHDYTTTTTTAAEMLGMILLGDRFHTADLEKASVWQFTKNSDGETVASLAGSFADIYDGLDDFASRSVAALVGLGVVTSGWAAPIDNDNAGLPSEHPQRRRVSLVYVAKYTGQCASRIYFPDNGEIIDEGEGRGQLAEYVLEALSSARSVGAVVLDYGDFIEATTN